MITNSTAGSRFRTAFAGEFEDPGLLYQTLLDQTVAALDLIEELEKVVGRDGLTVSGSRGQSIVNPAIPELRQQRAALAKLLGSMDLDDSGQSAGTALANVRWRKSR